MFPPKSIHNREVKNAMALKQAVCIPILPQGVFGTDELLQEIAEIGYDAVEIWQRGSDFQTFCESAGRYGLRLVSMIGHNALQDGLNNRANHNRIEVELKESIDVAADNGVSGLICFSGNRIAGMTESEAIANTAVGLRRVAPYAESKGINLNLELLNSKIDHAGYQCDHTAWGLSVIQQVQSPRVKLLYDIYHMQIMEGDVIRTMTDNLNDIGHIHTAGVPGRGDLNDDQELNYRGICRALSDAGYKGFVGHEFVPNGEVNRSRIVDALRQAHTLCTGL